MSNETTPPGTKGREKTGRTGRSGRKALIPLAAPPSLDEAGNPVGEVARLFDEWLQLRQATNRIRSPKTLDGYRDDMARWATLLANDNPAWDNLKLTDITRNRLVGALAKMNTAGLSVSARQRAMAPMRGLCRWLARQGHLQTDPTNDENLEIRSSPSRLPSSFNDTELAHITAAAAAGSDHQRANLRWPERDLATIALLAGAGLRSSEVCHLKWSAIADLDGDAPTVRVIGKGNKERVIPLGPHTATAIRTYRDQRRALPAGPLDVHPDREIIVRTNSDPITPSVLMTWVKQWLADAEVAPRHGAMAHAFRHTAADGWLANGATLAEVQALLGHASVATTGQYTKVRSETLSDVVKAGRFETVRQHGT